MGTPVPTLHTKQDVKPVKFLMVTFIPLLVGTLIAFSIFKFGDTDSYLSKIALIADFDLGWLYLGLVVLSRTVFILNVYTALAFKSNVKGNLRANPFIYKVTGSKAPDDVAVVFEDEGDIGKFNRGNRSLQHMVESFGGVIASVFAIGCVFPFPTFVIISVFCIGRILHQQGYIVMYGKHAKGFILALLSGVTLEGLALIVALKSFSVF